MDRLLAMRVFARVVEAGSFSRAAERLALSTTATSRLVADLETHLGARLLHRTTRRLSLTDAGRGYFERCTAILDEIDDAESAASSATQRATGTLRINAPVSFGARHLAELVPRYCNAHPDVTVDITLTDRQSGLVEEGYDLALRISEAVHSTLVARRLASARLVLVASPDYLARHGRPRAPADLAQHRCLGYAYTRGGVEWELGGAGGPHVIALRGPLRANNGDLLCQASIAGVGIALQPTFICAGALARGELEVLLPAFPPPELSIHAIYASRRHLSAKVRTFVDFLVTNLGEATWEHGSTPQDTGLKPANIKTSATRTPLRAR
ncbi:MAG: LysR family transcriptional regulator [Proteobacteria bacterium]|nr:LysR family transcriptional regulator [Burkholderiales bacterium]